MLPPSRHCRVIPATGECHFHCRSFRARRQPWGSWSAIGLPDVGALQLSCGGGRGPSLRRCASLLPAPTVIFFKRGRGFCFGILFVLIFLFLMFRLLNFLFFLFCCVFWFCLFGSCFLTFLFVAFGFFVLHSVYFCFCFCYKGASVRCGKTVL